GSNTLNIGEEISLPMLIVPPKGDNSLSWMLTPTFVAAGGGSVDAVAWGVLLGGGLTSSLSYQIAGFTFTLANQINYLHGIPVDAAGYNSDTNLEQEILTEGLKVTKTFGGRLFVDASISRNDFLQEAAIDHYWTPAAGVGFRFNDRAGL